MRPHPDDHHEPLSSQSDEHALSGGGLGGLTLALALANSADITVAVYEQAPAPAELGASVGVLRRPYLALKDMGLADILAEVTRIPDENAEGA